MTIIRECQLPFASVRLMTFLSFIGGGGSFLLIRSNIWCPPSVGRVPMGCR